MLALAAIVVLIRSRGGVVWHTLPILFGLLALVPIFQFAGALIPFSGQALTATTYLLGFLVAMLIGARWEQVSPDEAVNGILGAVGSAAIISVGLQLQQWLQLDGLEIWTIGMAGSRPFANLGQPNQLATLLMWGLVSTGWAVHKGTIRLKVALLMSCFILFGIALTQSKTAWICTILGVVATWFWRDILRNKSTPHVVFTLAAYFFVVVALLPYLTAKLMPGMQLRSLEATSGQLRLQAYELFIDAAVHSPLLGYGWSQLPKAQILFADQHPNLGGFFIHSHNIFLDLILWCGIPIGLVISVSLVYWLAHSLRKVISENVALLMCFIIAVAVHAMLELPLHYAYFLLPTGFMIGIISAKQNERVIVRSRRWSLGLLLVSSIGLLSVVVYDYLKVEANFLAFRFETAHVGTLPIGRPPDVIVLTHLREFVAMARYEPHEKMNNEELAWMKEVTFVFPSRSNLFNVAKALAINGQPAEALDWLRKIKNTMSQGDFSELAEVWKKQGEKFPALAKVAWPT